MRAAVLIAAVVGLLAGQAQGATASGVRGIVLKGPVRPVCIEDEPCTAPAAGIVLAFTRQGRTWRTTTRADGRYAIALRPGLYAVRVVPAPRIGTGLTPRTVRVPASRCARRDLMLDTGLQ